MPMQQTIIRKRYAAILAIAAVTAIPCSAQQDESAAWFLRGWGGYSSLADTDGRTRNFDRPLAVDTIDVSTSGGFTAGAGVGYRYNPRVAVELAWEYRSNDSETEFASGDRFNEGNYASNTFYLNGYYYLNARGNWSPYLGVGLALLQEVDIDLEGNGPGQSFASDGDVGFQLFVGSNYRLTNQWSAHGELRYGAISGIDLEGENSPGTLVGVDYRPLTLQFGLNYSF